MALSYAQFNREGGENLLVYNLPAIVNTNIVQAPPFANPGVTRITAAAAQSAPLRRQMRPLAPANPTPLLPDHHAGISIRLHESRQRHRGEQPHTQARYIPKNLPTGYVQSYHLTVQRQLGNYDTFEVSYVGEHGVKLQVLADLNQSAANAVTATCNPSVTSGCFSLAQRRPISDIHHHRGDACRRDFSPTTGLQSKDRASHRSRPLSVELFYVVARARQRRRPPRHQRWRQLAHQSGQSPGRARPVRLQPATERRPLHRLRPALWQGPYVRQQRSVCDAGDARRLAGNGDQQRQQRPAGQHHLLAQQLFNRSAPCSISAPTTAPATPSSPRVSASSMPGNQDSLACRIRFRSHGNAVSACPTSTILTAALVATLFASILSTNSILGLHKNFPLYPEGTSFDFRVEAFNIFNQTNYAFPQSGFGPAPAASASLLQRPPSRRASCSSPVKLSSDPS